MTADNIAASLRKQFAQPLNDCYKRRIVFWYDSEREYESMLDELDLPNVKLLRLAFKSVMKRRIIPTNPVDQADRPKSVQFIGNYYNAEEIKQLIDFTKDDPLHIVIIIAAYYGLCRSDLPSASENS